MAKQAVAKAGQTILKSQSFENGGPGTILADFEILLNFVGSNQLKTGGKSGSLPMDALRVLDELMTHPLRPKLMRPQMLSFPHLNGLYLLLRTTGLVRAEGKDERGRLFLDPIRVECWRQLNAVERWFTLLQAVFDSAWQTIRSNESAAHGPAQYFGYFLSKEPIDNRDRSGEPFDSAATVIGSWQTQTSAALLELFGLLDIPRTEPHDGENWRVRRPRFNAFGNELITYIFHKALYFAARQSCADDEDSDESDSWLGTGFREFYPDCQNTLPGPSDGTAEEFVDGVWQLKVSLGRVWRRIIVPADTSLEDLASGILIAFDFSNDHLYEFTFKGTHGKTVRVMHPEYSDGEFFANEFDVGYLPLQVGDTFVFHFDFGDDWMFKIKVEKILPINAKLSGPEVTESKGDAPSQYGDEDEYPD